MPVLQFPKSRAGARALQTMSRAGVPAPHGRSFSGLSMMLARLRRDVPFLSIRRVRPAAAFRSPKFGSLRSPRGAKMLRRTAPITTAMEAAIRPEFRRAEICMSILTAQLHPIPRMGEAVPRAAAATHQGLRNGFANEPVGGRAGAVKGRKTR